MSETSKQTKEYGVMTMFACLMLCTLINSPIVISPVIGEIIGEFKSQYSPTTIKMVLSLPKLTAMLVLIINTGFLVDRINNKTLGLIGTGLIGAFGVGSYFTTTFMPLLFFRGMLGIGVGLVSPFFVGYLARLWTGPKFKRLIGVKGTFSSLSSVIGSAIIGLLAVYSWRSAMLWYILPIIVFFLILFFVPSMPPLSKEERAAKKAEREAENAKMSVISQEEKAASRKVYYYAIGFFFFWILNFIVFTDLSLSISENGIGATGTAATVSSVRAFVGMISSIFYKEVNTLFKKYTMPFCLLLDGIGMLLIGMSNSVFMSIIGASIWSVGYGWGTVFFYSAASSGKKGGTRSVKNAGVLNIACDGGSFLSAIILDPIFLALGITAAAGELKLTGMVVAAAGVVFALVVIMMRKRVKPEAKM